MNYEEESVGFSRILDEYSFFKIQPIFIPHPSSFILR